MNMSTMKFLVVGLGSMGKRRVRCLRTLSFEDIIGFDPREDRRQEAAVNYGIKTISSLEGVNLRQFSAMVVSVPPDKHAQYAIMAIQNDLPVFIEASVILEDVESIKAAMKPSSYVAPSCTLRFHPMIKDITDIIRSRKYGKITNFSYHSGQYLPDWHPWEKISDFYVSNRPTGGGREIVPFELTWMVDTIGWPKEVKGFFEKTIDFGANIEDTYAFAMKYDGMVGNVLVDVASRYAVRNLIINMEEAQIQWKWDESSFSLYERANDRWIKYSQPEFVASAGYNKNIGEKMYVNELGAFVKGINGEGKYLNTIDDDIKVLQILNDIEKSDGCF